MTLEQKINKLINNFKDYRKSNIERWVWMNQNNKPDSLNHSLKKKNKNLLMLKLKIDILIDNASPEECESSRSWYIRACKNWMLKYNFKEHWSRRWEEHNK